MRRRIISLIGLVLCIKVSALSQSFIFDYTLKFGPAFPIGEFSNYDFQKGERGLAQPGFYIDASFVHNLKNKPFGYQAGFRFSSFSRDGEELFDTHVPEEGQYLFTVKMGKYNMAGVYGGLSMIW
ncbi:MAG: hypothetical protein KF763_01225 [Cyclobacteriaceae bacterium]|nr:hypothetical protein [Cyclobacteriaceae bacterium]